MKYQIIKGASRDVSTRVNDLMAKGWRLHGETRVLVVDYSMQVLYVQPMIFGKQKHIRDTNWNVEYGEEV